MAGEHNFLGRGNNGPIFVHRFIGTLYEGDVKSEMLDVLYVGGVELGMLMC